MGRLKTGIGNFYWNASPEKLMAVGIPLILASFACAVVAAFAAPLAIVPCLGTFFFGGAFMGKTGERIKLGGLILAAQSGQSSSGRKFSLDQRVAKVQQALQSGDPWVERFARTELAKSDAPAIRDLMQALVPQTGVAKPTAVAKPVVALPAGAERNPVGRVVRRIIVGCEKLNKVLGNGLPDHVDRQSMILTAVTGRSSLPVKWGGRYYSQPERIALVGTALETNNPRVNAFAEKELATATEPWLRELRPGRSASTAVVLSA